MRYKVAEGRWKKKKKKNLIECGGSWKIGSERWVGFVIQIK